MSRLTWLADAFRAEGCKVVEIDGWENAGRDGPFDPDGPGWHHTGTTTSSSNTHPTLNTCINGRSDLPGPLCHAMIGYDGTVYVIAAGRANHGGACNGYGPYTSSKDANEQIVGFEIDYDGTQPMSKAQKDAATRCSAAVLKKFGHDHTWATRHEEWSTTGKWDTGGVSGSQIREMVKDYMKNGPEEGVLGMTKLVKFSRSGDQPVSSTTTWKTLRLDDEGEGALSALIGPHDQYSIVASLTLTGLPVGEVAQFRFVMVIDYDGNKDTVVDTAYPIHEITGSHGSSFGQIAWINNLPGKSDDGGTYKLRLQALAPDDPYTVDRVVVRALCD